MLTEERHRYILHLIEERDVVHVQQLMEDLSVSESTIRRDLSFLEEKGALVRIHGGAKKPIRMEDDGDIVEKSVTNSHEKLKIALYASQLVHHADVIFIDAGTTTLHMIPLLKDKQITVVTNGVEHAYLLTQLGIETILIGGKIKHRTRAVVGSVALQQLQQYSFDKVFLGMNGVDEKAGYTTPDEEEAMIKRTASQRSYQNYVLVDSSKFSKIAFCRVMELKNASIITTSIDTETNRILSSQTDVHVVKE